MIVGCYVGSIKGGYENGKSRKVLPLLILILLLLGTTVNGNDLVKFGKCINSIYETRNSIEFAMFGKE